MKNFTIAFLLAVVCGLAGTSQPAYQKDSIQMGASYVYDVYYSMWQGEVAMELRNNWDIAFRAYPTSASILVNDGVGAMLWAWPSGSYADWATVDTNGLSGWSVLYNSPTDWEEGAFNAHATGHPDYGWGLYNQVTHNLVGDSIFILKTVNGPYKKVAILSKQSLAMIYSFRIANLDGSGDTTVTLDATTYAVKNFVYFDASTNAIVDREPLSADWDIVFTRYFDELSPGTFYLVTGVIQNYNVDAARYELADTGNLVWDPAELMTERNTIGYDWKTFSMGSYVVDDSMYFLVRDKAGDLYKVVFEAFAGSSTGKVVFRKALISPTGIDQISDSQLRVFPVPSSSAVTVVSPPDFMPTRLQVFDLQGRLVLATGTGLSSLMSVDLSELRAGIYMLQVSDANRLLTTRLIKN